MDINLAVPQRVSDRQDLDGSQIPFSLRPRVVAGPGKFELVGREFSIGANAAFRASAGSSGHGGFLSGGSSFPSYGEATNRLAGFYSTMPTGPGTCNRSSAIAGASS